MTKIIIFGVGKSSDIVAGCLKDTAEIVAYLDNNILEVNHTKNGVNVVSPKDIAGYRYDYIIIASLRYTAMKAQLLDLGIAEEKIICFFDYQNCNYQEYDCFLESYQAKFSAYEQFINAKVSDIENAVELMNNNLFYECMASLQGGHYKFPTVLSGHEAITRIRDEKCSLVRYGDGEFEIMLGRNRPMFQPYSESLKNRMLEIINNQDDGVITCIADNYGSLAKYTYRAANAIRKYLTPSVREEHMQLLDLNKTYYDTYLTRPYITMRDKSHAGEDFNELKSIWEKRDCVIVEGSYTRMGVGNDLFDNANSIERIICPSENAWNVYDRILEAAKSVDKEKLIVISLGPAATVLAYDLHKLGYQALDIGHIDNEYEWFLQNTEERTLIPGKYVHEVRGGNQVEEVPDEKYEKEIRVKVGNI